MPGNDPRLLALDGGDVLGLVSQLFRTNVSQPSDP
jgi:hypothetical protein